MILHHSLLLITQMRALEQRLLGQHVVTFQHWTHELIEKMAAVLSTSWNILGVKRDRKTALGIVNSFFSRCYGVILKTCKRNPYSFVNQKTPKRDWEKKYNLLPESLKHGMPKNKSEWIALVKRTKQKRPAYVLSGEACEYLEFINRTPIHFVECEGACEHIKKWIETHPQK